MFEVSLVKYPIVQMIVNMVVCSILSLILGMYYSRYGRSFSNRSSFSIDFTVIALTTCLVISIVQSSLALSLGLVGALSIVRFRTAIKDPEELAYLFVCIAIGLGAGANKIMVTTLGFFLILLFVHIRNILSNKSVLRSAPLQLHVKIPDSAGKDSLKNITGIVKEGSSEASVLRFDHSRDVLNVSYRVKVDTFEKLDVIKNDILDRFANATVAYIEMSCEYEV